LDVRKQLVRRRRVAITVALIMTAASSALVAPEATAGPRQEDPSSGSGEDTASQRGLVDIDVDVANDDASSVAEALGDIDSNVATQLAQLQAAETAVNTALATLAERDAAIVDTELRIEELTIQSDQVVIDAFTSPPGDAQLDALLTENAIDASLKQAYVDMQADRDATTLADLDAARDDLETLHDEQEEASAEAEDALADADAALSELQAAADQRTQFVLDIQSRIAAGEVNSATDPALAADIQQLTGALQEIEDAQALQELQEALDRAEQEAIARGDIVCPVQGGGLNFTDTWGAARSGGRSHKGVDMMASSGTPTPAPANGRVEYRNSGLGGMSWYVYADNGHTYYGTHLSQYGDATGWVEAGTIIGYVGSSGNASASAPHLHFEYHPGGGSPVNPYSLVDRACPSH
jgi:murein DD-endopeptidase MepM/ murein hydrolase activator NlpD